MQLLVTFKGSPDVDPESSCPVDILLDTGIDGAMEIHFGADGEDSLIPSTTVTVSGTRKLHELYLALQTYLQAVGYPFV